MADQNRHRSKRIGLNAVTSCISTTLMLVLLGTVVFFVTYAMHFSNNLRENFTISLILDDSLSHTDAYQLQSELRALPCSRLVTYISKERALREQSEALGEDPSEFMEENPMPASFEVHLKGAYANEDSLAQILPQLKSHPGVLDVSYPQSLMDSLNSNISRISTVMLIIALLLTVISFVLINNTIRLSVISHRFIIHTMKLVGAKWGYIRRPFLLKALIIGVISALLASAILAGGLYTLWHYESQMASLITWDVLAATFGIVVICGLLLTFVCAYITVNKAIHMKTSQLYRY
ncbi:MAG: permease-like cell division protein FtsX [Prevotellaceae bacterium]|nr:permease-like cell division protein FtsX [Prevotellaceae bacterium]MDY3856477.1 permease-like cell division protein FtsX [Bacteroidaceae bacterium]